ncbi:hypothetical protein BGZ57DRAFT_853847 [Hyaloscypha finlandica]|nr:hypothetical protein BGZ57DRAFT_853847 [Hyaloscypha finlandica]
MDPFVHLPEHDAILGDGKEYMLSAEEKQRIAKEVTSIPNLRTKKEQFNPAAFPPPNNPAIPELGAARTDGLQCQFEDEFGEPCRFIATHIRNIQKHCSKEHGWENPQESGRPKTGTEVAVPWRTGVHCQHFFMRSTGAGYFEVVRGGSSGEAIEEPEYGGFEFNLTAKPLALWVKNQAVSGFCP